MTSGLRLPLLAALLFHGTVLGLVGTTGLPPAPDGSSFLIDELDLVSEPEPEAVLPPRSHATTPPLRAKSAQPSEEPQHAVASAKATAPAPNGNEIANLSRTSAQNAEPVAPSDDATNADRAIAPKPTIDLFNPTTARALGMQMEESAESRHRGDIGMLQTTMDERDRALGLGGGGALVSAAHEALLGAAVPNRSNATFEITTDALGEVRSVRVVDADTGRKEWEQVVPMIKQLLARKRLRVPSGSRGVAARLQVDVAIRLPSGAQAAIGYAPGAVTFDLSDIGAIPKRVVGVRIVDEHPL